MLQQIHLDKDDGAFFACRTPQLSRLHGNNARNPKWRHLLVNFEHSNKKDIGSLQKKHFYCMMRFGKENRIQNWLKLECIAMQYLFRSNLSNSIALRYHCSCNQDHRKEKRLHTHSKLKLLILFYCSNSYLFLSFFVCLNRKRNVTKEKSRKITYLSVCVCVSRHESK